jgi:hypothetical protein
MAAPQRNGRPSEGSRRPRGERDGDFDSRPKKKTVKMHPAVGILLFIVLPLLSGGFFIYALTSGGSQGGGGKGKVIVEDKNEDYEEFKAEMKSARIKYKEAMNLRTSDDHDLFKQKIEAAKDNYGNLLEKLDAIVEPHRDPETRELPPAYSGYERDYDELQKRLEDLIKASPF